MIISLSVKCFTVFFSIELLIGYSKIFPLEMGGGIKWVREYVRNKGGRSKCTCAYDGGGR